MKIRLLGRVKAFAYEGKFGAVQVIVIQIQHSCERKRNGNLFAPSEKNKSSKL